MKIPSNTTLKTPLVAVFDDLDIEVEEDELKARGRKFSCMTFLYIVLPISLVNCNENSKSRGERNSTDDNYKEGILKFGLVKLYLQEKQTDNFE